MHKYLLLFALFFPFGLYAQHDVPATSGFEVVGAIKKTLRFQITDLSRFKQDTLGDLVIRNHRGEAKGAAKQMRGILLKTILDSVELTATKPKEYSELIIVLSASDGYKNVYSWNELFNSEVGNHVYIITEMDGKTINDMPNRILVVSLSDFNSGRRHLRGLSKIEFRKVD